MNTIPVQNAAALYADQTIISDMQANGDSATSLGLTAAQVAAVQNGTAQINWGGNNTSSK